MMRNLLVSIAAVFILNCNSFGQTISGISDNYSFDIVPKRKDIYNQEYPTPNMNIPFKMSSGINTFDEGVELDGSFPAVSYSSHYTIRVKSISNKTLGKVFIYGQGLTSLFESSKMKQDLELKEGKNEYTLQVQILKGTTVETLERKISITYVPQRKDYALIFAIDDYSGTGHISLDHCIDDAMVLGKILEKRFGFEVEIDSNVTVDDMKSKLTEYANKDYNSNDQLLVFFSGHGNIETVGTKKLGVFVGSDGNEISHGDFRDRLDAAKCNHILLLADACFSEAIKVKPGDLDALVNEMVRDKTFEQFVDTQFGKKTRKVITSGETQTKELSPMMKKIFQALDSGKLHYNKVISFYDIASYVGEAEGASWGIFSDDDEADSDFLFFYKSR